MEIEVLDFAALGVDRLHALLKLRVDVFVVEQECPYPEIDGLDPRCRHLLMSEDGRLAAYARWYREGEHTRLGRIVVDPARRGEGLGQRVMEETLARIDAEVAAERSTAPAPVLIHAQAHLEGFYAEFGFVTVRGPFDEDGIPHLEMVRAGGG